MADRTSMKFERLAERELEKFRLGVCPDCDTAPLLEGPHGGLSVNYGCGNPECGSRFNDMGPFGVERISEASPDRVRTGQSPYR